MVSWFKRLFARVSAPVATPVVLGLELQAAPKAPSGRVLRWRGFDWVQRGAVDGKGKLTFVREVAIDGRPVPVEVQVLETDLEAGTDGTLTLRGRE